MNNQTIKVFDFLPHEKVKPVELRRGDVAKLRDTWEIVLEACLEGEVHYGYQGYSVKALSGLVCYYRPDEFKTDTNITIVKRELIDPSIEQFIADELAEEVRQQELMAQRERRELAQMRKQLLRDLEALGEPEEGEDLEEDDEEVW